MKIWTNNFDTVLKHVKDGTAKDINPKWSWKFFTWGWLIELK